MRKLAYLDGLRGIAAMIVVFHHLALMFCPAMVYGEDTASLAKFCSTTPLNIFYNGDFAVSLFFVLSGYVLSYKYVLLNDPRIIIGYAVKRYFRLMPLIGSSVIFIVLCIKMDLINTAPLNGYTQVGDWLLGFFKTDATFLQLLENIFYGILFFGDNTYNPVVWSMQVEFLGSMLLFAFILLNHKVKWKWILFIAALILAVYYKHYYYMAFLMGYGLCYLNETNKIKPLPRGLKLLVLLLAIILSSFPASWLYWKSSMYRVIYFDFSDVVSIYHIAGSTLFLLLTLKHLPAEKFLSLKPIRFLGKISFPLYLFHIILLILIANPIFVMCYPHLGYFFSFLVCVIVSLPVLFGVSYLANRLIDQPALRFANVIEKWFLLKVLRWNGKSKVR